VRFNTRTWLLQVPEINDGQYHSNTDFQEGRTSARDSWQKGR